MTAPDKKGSDHINARAVIIAAIITGISSIAVGLITVYGGASKQEGSKSSEASAPRTLKTAPKESITASTQKPDNPIQAKDGNAKFCMVFAKDSLTETLGKDQAAEALKAQDAMANSDDGNGPANIHPWLRAKRK